MGNFFETAILVAVLLVVVYVASGVLLFGGLGDLIAIVGNPLARLIGLQGIPGKAARHGTGIEGLLLKEATVAEDFLPQESSALLKGRVLINSEIWNANGSIGFKQGEKVLIDGVEGLILKVSRSTGAHNK